MDLLWLYSMRHCCIIWFLTFTYLPSLVHLCANMEINKLSYLDRELKTYIDELVGMDNYKIIPGIYIERNSNASTTPVEESCQTARHIESLEDYFNKQFSGYASNHHIAVNIPETARFFNPVDTGKSSFLTGFGMGFLAFALKKLLLPVFIGVQLVKSVLIALFLPSILGHVGKLLGKGLSSVSGISGASGGFGAHGNEPVNDFEFKDTSPYANEVDLQDANSVDESMKLNVVSPKDKDTINRLGYGNQGVSYTPYQSDSYYLRKPSPKTDYKVFHKIPPSSLLLTTYDPFYSPLLSRLDAVFQQLGFGNEKSPQTERCRERLICMMYGNPAKYAPYSNLVSAQLSRELNELRKPASDNPEILRFFRYMRAAKDGQDGEECLAHKGCPTISGQQSNPAMLTTFNDINKLVQARKLK